MASKPPRRIVTATVDPVHVARIEQREIRGAPMPEVALPGFRYALSGLSLLANVSCGVCRQNTAIYCRNWAA